MYANKIEINLYKLQYNLKNQVNLLLLKNLGLSMQNV